MDRRQVSGSLPWLPVLTDNQAMTVRTPPRHAVTPATTDARADRSRDAIRRAFFALVLAQPYDRISVAAVIRSAGVARSTFYEHYRDKDALLADSLSMPFKPLADAVLPDAPLPPLAGALAHFHDNRRMALGILHGGFGRRAGTVLAAMIEQRLRGCGPLPVPAGVVALQVAAMQLATIGAWLDGRISGTAGEVARVVARGSRALAQGVVA
jgi:AcrR family transcriptional regulator